MVWPGAYLDRYEPQNFDYWGMIEAIEAPGTVLDGNHICCSERVGYHGELEDITTTDPWLDNDIHSNLVGVGIYSQDSPTATYDWRIANITAWKNWDFGIYYIQ